MKNTYVSNEENTFFQKPHLFFEVYFGLFLRNPCFFFENKKEPQRNCEQFPGSSASRSLICVRKRRKTIMTKHPSLRYIYICRGSDRHEVEKQFLAQSTKSSCFVLCESRSTKLAHLEYIGPPAYAGKSEGPMFINCLDLFTFPILCVSVIH